MLKPSNSLPVIAAVVFAAILSADLLAADANKPAAVTSANAAEPNLAAIDPNTIIARYGSEKLTLRQVEYLIPAPKAVYARQVVQQWLDLQMLYSAAQKRGLTEDPKAKLIADMDAKHAYARELMDIVSSHVNITDANVRQYYDRNKNIDPQLSEPMSLSFMHIRTKTLEEANSVKKRIAAGEDMAKIARELSTAPDSRNGGTVKRAPYAMLERQFGKEFVDALLAAPNGSLTGPIKVRDGYEVVRPEGTLAKKILPFEEVRDSIRHRLDDDAREDAKENLLAELHKQSEPIIFVSPVLNSPVSPQKEQESELGSLHLNDKPKIYYHPAN